MSEVVGDNQHRFRLAVGLAEPSQFLLILRPRTVIISAQPPKIIVLGVPMREQMEAITAMSAGTILLPP